MRAKNNWKYILFSFCFNNFFVLCKIWKKTFKCDKKLYEKINFRFGLNKNVSKLFFLWNCRKNKTWQQRGKKFHVTQHVGRFWRERANLSNYTFHIECMHFHDIYFIVFILCLRYREMNVCLLCLIFVNSFYKNTHKALDDESWQLYTLKKGIMNLWKGHKKCIKITLGHCRKPRHKHGATNIFSRMKKSVTKLKRTPEMRSGIWLKGLDC